MHDFLARKSRQPSAHSPCCAPSKRGLFLSRLKRHDSSWDGFLSRLGASASIGDHIKFSQGPQQMLTSDTLQPHVSTVVMEPHTWHFLYQIPVSLELASQPASMPSCCATPFVLCNPTKMTTSVPNFRPHANIRKWPRRTSRERVALRLRCLVRYHDSG